jgi:hypothetical protein
MKRAIRVILFASLVIGLISLVGCGLAGGADVTLEGLSLGTVTMDGKPVAGLPSDKINLSLEVSAQRVLVNTSANGTIITLVPSGATIEIESNNVSIKGVKPEQIKVEWAVTQGD